MDIQLFEGNSLLKRMNREERGELIMDYSTKHADKTFLKQRLIGRTRSDIGREYLRNYR